jgi:hypothetical protein
MNLLYGAPDGELRHMRQLTTEPGTRSAAPSVAEALRSRFPLSTEPGRRRARISVAEALHSRLVPLPREPMDTGAAPGGTHGSTAGAGSGSRSLPRRIRNLSVSARRAQAAAPPELLLRILDGLQRL